mgnify:CR=1 FL=1
MTQRDIIKAYIESTGWIKEGLVRGINTDKGFIGFRGDRTVREMLREGILEGKMDGKFRVVRVKPRVQLPSAFVPKEDSRQDNMI